MLDNCGRKIRTIAIVFLIVGLIASLVLAITFGKNKWGEFNFWSFILILAGGAFVVFLNALLLNGFGLIVENNEAQLAASAKPTIQPKQDAEKEILENGGWKCICGRVNASYVSNCACGKSKSEGNVSYKH